MATCDAHLFEGMSHLPGQPAPEHWRVFPLHEGSPPYCAVTCPTCHPPVHIDRIEVHADDPDRLACGDPKCGQPGDVAPTLIDGLTPGECRDRWEANAAAIESGMARPYALSPDQIAEGKRLHVEARKAGR